MGISILSPDVNESYGTFTPRVAEGENAIRFGLAAIKSVGEGDADSIIKEREADGPYRSFSDFIVRATAHGVTRRAIEALVKTGAFDSLDEERAAILEAIDGELASASSQRADRAAGQTSLFEMMDDFDEPAQSAPGGGSKVPPMPLAEKLQYEKELLGFYISGHPMDAFAGIDQALDAFTDPDELNLYADRSTIRLCGILSKLQRKYTRKDNKPMAIFNLATREHTYEFIAFPESYARFGTRIEEGMLCLVHGLVGRRNGELSLSAHEVSALEAAIPRLIQRVVFILDPVPSAAEFIHELRETIDREYGETKVGVAFLIDGDILEADVPTSLCWTLTGPSFKRLRKHPAVCGIRVESAPIQPIDDRKPWEKRKPRT